MPVKSGQNIGAEVWKQMIMREKIRKESARRRVGHSGQRGYVLIALTLGLVFILGMAGLAVDIGRMYVTKSEAQSFVDSAAFSGALQLDGTAAGITRAQNAVTADPKKWQFQTNSFTSVTTQFATA